MTSRRRDPSPHARLTPLCFMTLFALVLIGTTAGPGRGSAAWAAKASQCTDASGTQSQTVCVAAESFVATLSVSQQSSLFHALTTANEERWSDLPCGSSCRNGVELGTLSSVQLQAALAVAKAALSPAGYDTFDGIRNADDYLAQNGGGGQYGSGLYFIAFLGTPSSTTPWMLQLGGHDYALNFYFQGPISTPTPYFTGVEPPSFTLNGIPYAPMQAKTDAAKAMLAGLSPTDLASAHLSGSFADVLLGPDRDNQFPAIREGLNVSALSADQQALVVNTIKAWVDDMPAAVADSFLADYTSDAALGNTFVGWAGGSQLATPGSYLRIDGPRIWIEIATLAGEVFPSQVQYHSVWRDKTFDYGSGGTGATPGTLSFTGSTFQTQEGAGTATLTVRRTGGTDGAVSVDYAVSGGTATAGQDYQDVTGTLSWANGDGATKTIQIPIFDDAIVENPETVLLTLVNPLGGAALGGPSTATLTIADNDFNTSPGEFSFTATVFRAPEGSGGVTVNVQRLGGSHGAASVRLAAINGGATAGVDYKLPLMRMLRWADGDSATKSLRVTFLNDSIRENNERFQLMLTSPTGGATLGTPVKAIVTILNDD
jgi:hypothetical protein